LTTVLNEQPLFVQPVVKPSCTIGLITSCIHDTTGCQTGLTTDLEQVASCKWGFSISQLTNLRLSLGRARDMY